MGVRPDLKEEQQGKQQLQRPWGRTERGAHEAQQGSQGSESKGQRSRR